MLCRRSFVVIRLLLCSCLLLGLGACARPAALLETGVRLLEEQTHARLLPVLPSELILEALRAIDRGDRASVRALFAPGAPAPDAAITRLATRWPGALFGQPAAVVGIGPYPTVERFAPVQIGQIAMIPIRGRCAKGTLEAHIVVQMTAGGWRLFDVHTPPAS
ncbi:MAG: hypothetical protein HXY37_12765 [Chloroflexi bacterium]|nr:hypothetical protein [Chloroflexota bacterium]